MMAQAYAEIRVTVSKVSRYSSERPAVQISYKYMEITRDLLTGQQISENIQQYAALVLVPVNLEGAEIIRLSAEMTGASG